MLNEGINHIASVGASGRAWGDTDAIGEGMCITGGFRGSAFSDGGSLSRRRDVSASRTSRSGGRDVVTSRSCRRRSDRSNWISASERQVSSLDKDFVTIVLVTDDSEGSGAHVVVGSASVDAVGGTIGGRMLDLFGSIRSHTEVVVSSNDSPSSRVGAVDERSVASIIMSNADNWSCSGSTEGASWKNGDVQSIGVDIRVVFCIRSEGCERGESHS